MDEEEEQFRAGGILWQRRRGGMSCLHDRCLARSLQPDRRCAAAISDAWVSGATPARSTGSVGCKQHLLCALQRLLRCPQAVVHQVHIEEGIMYRGV